MMIDDDDDDDDDDDVYFDPRWRATWHQPQHQSQHAWRLPLGIFERGRTSHGGQQHSLPATGVDEHPLQPIHHVQAVIFRNR